MRFTASSIFNTDETTFWNKVFFEPEYTRDLYMDGLAFADYKLVNLTGEPGGARTRTMVTEPKSEAPAVVTKLIGGSISYTENGSFDPSKREWTFKMTTSKLTDKVSVSGRVWCEPRGDKKIERFIETDLTVHVFGVGGTIEKFIESTTRDSYKKTEAFTNAWIAKKGL